MNGTRAAERAQLDVLLRSCVQCGLCLPHCATYLATGNEADSPRGRLLLLADALAADAPPSADAAAALERCLGCRACETACPSGVTADLLERGRDLGRDAGAGGDGLAALISPERLPLVGTMARWAESVLETVAGDQWRVRLAAGPLRTPARLVGSRPTAPDADDELISLLDGLSGLRTPPSPALPPPAKDRGPATLFPGCANLELLSGSQRRLASLLASLGWRVTVPEGTACCGAMDSHAGRPRQARDRRHALAEPVGPWVVEAAGCGLELARSEHPAAEAVTDAAVLLAAAAPVARRAVPLTVAYHDPCHARHGRGIESEPRALLDAIPELVRREPEESDVCCGSGGAYALDHPLLSELMGRRKAAHLAATGCDLVVTSNPGCLGQIRDALLAAGDRRPVLPLTDLLWYARLGRG